MSAARTVLVTAVVTTAAVTAAFYAAGPREAPSPRETAVPAARAVAEPPPVAEHAPAAEDPKPAEPDPPPAAAAGPTALEEIVGRAMPAVVRVETPGSFGSGFFVRSDTVLTNVHVVAENTSVTLRLQNGTTQTARVDVKAPELDIAILRVPVPNAEQPTLTLGSAARARPGQEVVVLGTPMGLQNTVTRGIVSALRQTGAVTLVQTDAAVNPGNSGGPVLDREGTVIGIATMSVRSAVAQGLSFAVAIDHATGLLAGRAGVSATSSTPLSALNQAMGAAPPGSPSESELRRQNGTREYEQTVGQLARRADELDRYWTQFARVCYSGEIATGFDRDWFALFEARAMKGTVSPGCLVQFGEVQRAAGDIRSGVAAADEAARRADVYPGVRRDILRRHRLDYAGWSR